MADLVAIEGLGAFAEIAEDHPAEIKMMLLKQAEADALLRDYNTIADLLAQPGNVEADFTNYTPGGETVPAIDVTRDEASNKKIVDSGNVEIQDAGGAVDNDIVKAIVFHALGTDAQNRIMCIYDAEFSTNGSTVTIQTPSGLYEATDPSS